MLEPHSSSPSFPRPKGDVPVGSVVAYAGALAEPIAKSAMMAAGWLVCDGSALPVPLYHELFAALGYCYGGDGERFNVPDYRNAGGGLGPVSYIIKFTTIGMS